MIMLSYVTSALVFCNIHVPTAYLVMSFLVNLLYLNVGILFVCAQNDGRYRPVSSSVTKKPVIITDGRYRPTNDGRYNPANDGKYRPDNDGKYIHIGDKDRGLYTGGGGEYTGGGEEYSGGGGEYTGSGSKGGNGGDYNGEFGKYNGGSGRNNGVKNPTTAKPKPKPDVNSGTNKDGWKIIRDEKTEDTDGYHYLYETENRILAEESGRIENLAPNEDGLRSKGFYQYTGDDGVLYRVDYVADNNGFVPQGDHIPKTPPAIQKLLDYLASQS